MLRLYRDIFGIQRRHLSGLEVSVPTLESLQIKARLEEGLPLLDRGGLEIDAERLLEIMDEVKSLLARRSRRGGDARLSLTTLELDRDEAEGLARARLRGDYAMIEEKAEEMGVDANVLGLMLHASLAPFFQKAAQALHPQADLDQGLSAACPICGEPAVMGFNRDGDGLRVLECSLCSTRWGTPRMLCLFCGTPDQSKLGYLFVNEDRRRRIHTCKKCNKYIKVTDCQGRTEEIVLPLEDLFTSYLDEVAQNKGYQRGCRTALS
jgi:FdhE protein